MKIYGNRKQTPTVTSKKTKTIAAIITLAALLSCGQADRSDSGLSAVDPITAAKVGMAVYGAYKANQDENKIKARFNSLKNQIAAATGQIINAMERIDAGQNIAASKAYLDYFSSYNILVTNNDLQGRGHEAIRQLERLTLKSSPKFAVEAVAMLNVVAPAQAIVMLRNGSSFAAINQTVFKTLHSVNDQFLNTRAVDYVLKLKTSVKKLGFVGNLEVMTVFGFRRIGPGVGSGKKGIAKIMAPMLEIYRSIEAAQKDVAKQIGAGVRARSFLKGVYIRGDGWVASFDGKGSYCGYSSPTHLKMAGSSISAAKNNGTIPDLYPATLKSTGACKVKIPKGFFKRKGHSKMYWSNGHNAYCYSSSPVHVPSNVKQYDFDIYASSNFANHGPCGG